MCAGQTEHVDDELLQPIPKEQFDRLLEGSKMSPQMREAVRRVLVPDVDKDGLPIRDVDGNFTTLSINEAAAVYNLAPPNVGRAVRGIQKKWNKYLLENGQVMAYGAVSVGFFQAMRVFQNECLSATKSEKPKRARKKPQIEKPS